MYFAVAFCVSVRHVSSLHLALAAVQQSIQFSQDSGQWRRLHCHHSQLHRLTTSVVRHRLAAVHRTCQYPLYHHAFSLVICRTYSHD